jgi:branched-chain amino acid transport system permease protein
VGVKRWIERRAARAADPPARYRHVGAIAAGALLVIAAVSPLLADSVGRDLAVRITYYVLLVASWNLLAGYAGLYSFGHVAFAAIGAYSTVVLVDREGIPIELAFLVGGVVAGTVGALLGLLSSRIRGPYLVVASFGLLVTVQTIVLANPSLTGGASGSVIPELLGGANRELHYYALGLLLIGMFFGFSVALLRSRAGKVLAALRDDEDGAVAIGINPLPWKTGIFAYTSFWAGIAGVFLAYYTGFITPSMGGVPEMSIVVAMGIAGGLGTLVGPVISTGVLLYLSDKLRVIGEGYSSLLFGVALLFVVVAMPRIVRRLRAWRSQTAEPPMSAPIEAVAGPGTAGRP